MDEPRLIYRTAIHFLLAGAAAFAAGCAAVASGGMHGNLKHSASETSCETGRAHTVGAIDTVDADWLIKPLHILSYSDPTYPPAALAAGTGGDVTVRVLVGPDGTVQRIISSRGAKEFTAAAVDMVKGVRISSPRAAYGGPVMVCTAVNVTFQPKDGGVAWVELQK